MLIKDTLKIENPNCGVVEEGSGQLKCDNSGIGQNPNFMSQTQIGETTTLRMESWKKNAYLDFELQMPLLSSFSLLPSSTFQQLRWFPIPMCRFVVKRMDGNVGSSNVVRVCYLYTMKSRSSAIVKASADIDGTGATSSDAAPESEKPAVSVESLPSESKLQEKIDQKLRIKLAKKVRLRRKRLVRKRQSKMKKLKNV